MNTVYQDFFSRNTPNPKQDEDYWKWCFHPYKWELHITTRFPERYQDKETICQHQQLCEQILYPLEKLLKTGGIAATSVVVPAHRDKFGVYKAPHMHTLVISKKSVLADKIDEVQEFIYANIGKCNLLRNEESCIALPITEVAYHHHATRYLAKHLIAINRAYPAYTNVRLLDRKRIKNEENSK